MNYYLLEKGIATGPFSKEDIVEKATPDSWIRTEDSEWKKISSLKEFKNIFSQAGITDNEYFSVNIPMSRLKIIYKIVEDKLRYETGAGWFLTLFLFIIKWWYGLIALVIFFLLDYFVINRYVTKYNDDHVSVVKDYLEGILYKNKIKSILISAFSIIMVIGILFFTNPSVRLLERNIKKDHIAVTNIKRANLGICSLFYVNFLNFSPHRGFYVGILNHYIGVDDHGEKEEFKVYKAE